MGAIIIIRVRNAIAFIFGGLGEHSVYAKAYIPTKYFIIKRVVP